MTDDDFKSLWQTEFAPMFHPHMPLRSTLIELSDKLDGAAGFLGTLSSDDATEKQRGLFVAGLAVNYANKLLEHFHLLDGSPKYVPTGLRESQKVIENLQAFAMQQLEQDRQAQEADDGDTQRQAMLSDAAATSDSDAIDAENDYVVDEGTFTVWYRGRECFFGNGIPFKIINYLNSQRRGTFVTEGKLMDDVWADDVPMRDALQRQISIIRSKLKGENIEGIEIENTPGAYRLKIH